MTGGCNAFPLLINFVVVIFPKVLYLVFWCDIIAIYIVSIAGG